MKVLKILLLVLLMGFGVFLVIFGEHDDSPGAQGLGVILAASSIYAIVKKS